MLFVNSSGHGVQRDEGAPRFADLITVRQYGRGCFIYGEPAAEDCAVKAGLDDVRAALVSGVRGLDEANIATSLGLFTVRRLLEVIAARPTGGTRHHRARCRPACCGGGRPRDRNA